MKLVIILCLFLTGCTAIECEYLWHPKFDEGKTCTECRIYHKMDVNCEGQK